MTRRGRFAGGLLAAALLTLVLAGTAGAGVRVKQVDLTAYPAVALTVVTPRITRYAPTLRENGLSVTGYTAKKLRSKSVVLAVDRSTSMRGRSLVNAAAAARRFVAQKPNDDRIALTTFGSTALLLTSFGTPTIDVDSGLRTLAVDSKSGTALYDAIVLSANALAKQPRPRLLILLTDGQDVGSTATLGEAIAAAQKGGVSVYAIGIQGKQLTPGPLRSLARATGGTYYSAASSDRLAQTYARIAAELKRTWELAYFTTARPGDHPKIAVSFRRLGGTSATIAIPESFGKGARGKSDSLFGARHWWSALFVGLLAGLLIFLAVRRVLVKPTGVWVRERLEPWMSPEKIEQKTASEETGQAGILAPIYGATEGALSQLRIWRKLERVLERADAPLRTVECFYLMVGCSFVLSLVAAIAGSSPFVIILLFVVGGLAPYFFFSIKATKRLASFEAQLPTALNTVAASLKAGHSFRQALQTLVEEGGPPIDSEFNRVLTQARLGRSMEAALREMGRRVGSKELDFALRAVVIQSQVGGSLAQLFELVSETLTQRQQFRQKVKTLTASGRISAMILIAMPFFVAGLISLGNPGYLDPLLHTGTGQVLTLLTLLMMATGALFLRRITSFRGYR